MNQHTYEKLVALKVEKMAAVYRDMDEMPDADSLTFDQKMELMVDAECDYQESKKLERRIRNARFADRDASIESIKYFKDRQLDRKQILSLASNQYIHQPKNVFLIGATGSGKTYLSCALGNSACQNNYRVRYIRMAEYFAEFNLARQVGNVTKVIKRLSSYDLLIIDDWLLYPTVSKDLESILEVIEKRYKHKATIICSQYEVDGWHKKLGGGAIADAILDRLTAKSETILIKGNSSMRSRSEE